MRDDLGNRLKENYEDRYRFKLTRRTPVILRSDGVAFHTFCRGFAKPYDVDMVDAMNYTAMELCRKIQGTQLAFVASDEISLLLVDYTSLTTDAWFDYNLQKVVSVAAAKASVAFNKTWDIKPREKKADALFDCRAFNIPESEVTNYFYWRQSDWTRNSIIMLTSCYYSHKEMQGKGRADQHEMLHEKGVNWNDYPTSYKRGRCVVKTEDGGWTIDNEIPIFKGEEREYVERFVRMPND